MSSREDLEFLFEAVSDLLHMEARGGASELRADKFDKRWKSYRESARCEVLVVERIREQTTELANELGRLRKRVAELERATGALEEAARCEVLVVERIRARIEEQFPDDL